MNDGEQCRECNETRPHRHRHEVVWLEHYVTISDVRNKPGETFDLVVKGATVVVRKHGRPIARIVPIEEAESQAFLQELVESGVRKGAGYG